jgi:ferric-dicitrate binding protein FerR (iron transport regulator)
MSTHLPSEIDVAVLLRYLTGESPADEARHVEAWRDRSPANAARLAALRHGADGDAGRIRVDVERGLARLRERLDSADTATRTLSQIVVSSDTAVSNPVTSHASRDGRLSGRRARPSAPSTWSRWSSAAITTAMAAVAALVVGVTAYSVGRWHRAPKLTSTVAKVFRTAPGQRATLSLPDGTHVILSVDSKLSYPVGFGVASRDVVVEGEAYFEVVHNANDPFTVHAGNSKTTVLGTSFAVRHYAGDTTVRVVVASGRVAVDAAVVNAGDVAFRSAHALYVAHDTTAARMLSWITGQLTFDNVPLRDVLPELSRWYGVTFRWDPAIGSESLTSSFTNRSLEDVLRALTEQRGLTFTRTGNTIFIRKGQ